MDKQTRDIERLEQLQAMSAGDIYYRMKPTWDKYRYNDATQKAMAFDFYMALRVLVPPAASSKQ